MVKHSIVFKFRPAVLLGCLYVLISRTSAQTDSLEMLFSDTQVRKYALSFYMDSWPDTLKAYYVDDLGYIPARFSDGTITLDSVGVRYKGNSSYSAAASSRKKPYKIKFNEFKDAQTYYGAKVLNFSNAYGDPSFLREKLAYDLARAYMPSPRATFATLSTNDTLIGLYTQIEQVDKPFLAYALGEDSQNLYKASDAGSGLLYSGSTAASYSAELELKTNETQNDWSGMLAFLDFLNNEDSTSFCAAYQDHFSADNVTAFLALNMVLSHFDSYTGSGRNYYLYQQAADQAMIFIPWDMNLAFGGYTNGWDVYNQSAMSTSNLASRPLLRRILSCDSLRYKYLGYIRHMIGHKASVDSLSSQIDRLAPLIRPYVEADPNKFYTLENFNTNLNANLRFSTGSIPGLLSFAQTRNAFLLAEVDSLLPLDYVLPVRNIDSKNLPQLRHVDGEWFLEGLEAGQSYLLEAFQPNGALFKRWQAYPGGKSLKLNLPSGLVLLKASTAYSKQYFSIYNP